MQKVLVLCVVAGIALMAGCASTPKVTRTDASQQIDLSGSWNDTDSQLVSKKMIGDILAHPWIAEFTTQKQTKPRVIVGTVINKSHEHITTETFTKDLERELINSGKVRFVASKDQRDEIREERMGQTEHARMDTAKNMGQEYGADYMVKGQINTIFDGTGATELKYYQIELELIDIESNEKVWIGQEKIKKIIQTPKRKW